MSSRARRAIVTLCIAAAAFVAGWLLGRGEGARSDLPAESRPVVAAGAAAASAPRAFERAPSRSRRRAGPEPEPTIREPLRADGPGGGSAAYPPAATVRMRIRGRDGAPVRGAGVRVTATGGTYLDWEGVLPSSPVTDADGSIAIDIPKSVFDDYSRLEVGVTADGFAPRVVHVPLSSVVGRSGDAKGAIDVGLDRTIEVRGRCVDRARKAIAGVNVLGPRGAATTTTDAEGHFRLTGVAETGGYVRFFPGQLPLAAVRVELSSASHGIVDLGDVLLESGDTLRGRFLDAAGNPIAGARAILVSRELEGVLVGAEVTTDADGRFTFEHVGLGTFDVGLSRPGVPLDGLTDIAYGVRASEEVIVRATRTRYVGVVFVDEDRQAVQFRGGRVTWFALDDASDRLDWWGVDGGWAHFHIAARPGATYEVRIELDGYELTVLRVTATESLDTHFDAVLRRKAP